jgi:hypothetical protein
VRKEARKGLCSRIGISHPNADVKAVMQAKQDSQLNIVVHLYTHIILNDLLYIYTQYNTILLYIVLYTRYHWYNMPIRDGIMVSLSMMTSSFSLWWNESSWHQFCSPLQDAARCYKQLKLFETFEAGEELEKRGATFCCQVYLLIDWLIACFCDSRADKIPRQLGLAWTLHCHRLVSGLAYESSSVGIAVRLSCVGPLTSFDIGKLRSINLSGKQHDFWPFSILVWGPLLRSLAFDPMTCNSFI